MLWFLGVFPGLCLGVFVGCCVCRVVFGVFIFVGL